jgi:hypothetical protein
LSEYIFLFWNKEEERKEQKSVLTTTQIIALNSLNSVSPFIALLQQVKTVFGRQKEYIHKI